MGISDSSFDIFFDGLVGVSLLFVDVLFDDYGMLDILDVEVDIFVFGVICYCLLLVVVFDNVLFKVVV